MEKGYLYYVAIQFKGNVRIFYNAKDWKKMLGRECATWWCFECVSSECLERIPFSTFARLEIQLLVISCFTFVLSVWRILHPSLFFSHHTILVSFLIQKMKKIQIWKKLQGCQSMKFCNHSKHAYHGGSKQYLTRLV